MTSISIFVLDSSTYGERIVKGLEISGYSVSLYPSCTKMLQDSIPKIKPDIFILSTNFEESNDSSCIDLVSRIRHDDPRAIIIGFVARDASKKDMDDLLSVGCNQVVTNSISMIKCSIISSIRSRMKRSRQTMTCISSRVESVGM